MTSDNLSQSARLAAHDPDTIRRLITNQKDEHTPHAFRAGHGGMEDFNRLVPVLRTLPPEELLGWMHLIDEVCASHRACLPCSCKILIYSWLITKNILPEKSARYLQIYEERTRRYPPPADRDYQAEVVRSLRGCPEGPEARAHKNYWHQELEVLLSGMKRGD